MTQSRQQGEKGLSLTGESRPIRTGVIAWVALALVDLALWVWLIEGAITGTLWGVR